MSGYRRRRLKNDAFNPLACFLQTMWISTWGSHAAPLDLLKLLANTFGVEVVVGSTAGRKFILYERLPPGEPLLTAKVAQRFALEFLFRKTQDGGAEVAVAYGIDMARYRESLLRHKIDAPEMP